VLRSGAQERWTKTPRSVTSAPSQVIQSGQPIGTPLGLTVCNMTDGAPSRGAVCVPGTAYQCAGANGVA
jgi:hypothetical protein